MDTASIADMKKKLAGMSPKALTEVCLRLARHKKDTKELLHYLLFESADEPSFIKSVKEELEADFSSMNTSNGYLAKKTLRKIATNLNKYVRYNSNKETEAVLCMYFCELLQQQQGLIHLHPVIRNTYLRQLKKAANAIEKLHPDLQYDLTEQLQQLKEFAERASRYF